jgi:hypothetical protein
MTTLLMQPVGCKGEMGGMHPDRTWETKRKLKNWGECVQDWSNNDGKLANKSSVSVCKRDLPSV